MNNSKLRVELDPHQEFSAIGFLISKVILKSRKSPIKSQFAVVDGKNDFSQFLRLKWTVMCENERSTCAKTDGSN